MSDKVVNLKDRKTSYSIMEESDKPDCTFCGEKPKNFYIIPDRSPETIICGECIVANYKSYAEG